MGGLRLKEAMVTPYSALVTSHLEYRPQSIHSRDPQLKRNIEKLEWIQRTRGLETISYEDRMEELGMFGENSKFQRQAVM